jgi:hypothetical protein
MRYVTAAMRTMNYLGVGILCHLLFLGSHFLIDDLWSWVWLFGWPIALFVSGLLVCFALGIVLVAGLGLWTWIDSLFANRRAKQLRRELNAAALYAARQKV